MGYLRVGDIFYINRRDDLKYKVLAIRDSGELLLECVSGSDKGWTGGWYEKGTITIVNGTPQRKGELILRKIAVMEKRFINKRSK